jgi:demethylmenaquinone methyltransferase / 2-methoxy-6-polyprenyl-1,4-benzoquinol methylase
VDVKARDRLVERLFRGTESSYDDIVEAATQGDDRRWKDELVAELGAPRRVLDLACGTGILTFLIRERFPEAEVVGVDMTAAYLDVARARARERGDGRVSFLHSSAEDADAPGPFDAIVSCYLPKYADLPRLVPSLVGKLAPGGVLAMQDFAYPSHPGVLGVWNERFERLRTWAAEQHPAARTMFDELPEIIRASRWIEELSALLEASGLATRVTRQSWGTSALVVGRKPEYAEPLPR